MSDTPELKAGRELDALVAEKVMEIPPKYITIGPAMSVLSDSGGTWIDCQPVPRYSTDIAAAWEVVERRGGFVRVTRFLTNEGWVWEASIIAADHRFNCFAETAPLAICLAALKAVEAA